MTPPLISRRALVHYGFIALPIAFAGFPLYVLAPDLYAVQHGLSLTAIGIMLLLLRMLDAVQDPIIGALSDRFAHRIYAIITVAAVMLVAGIYALFHPARDCPAVWFLLSMLIAVTAHGFLSINLASLGALWTDNSTDQTRISAMREGFGLIGILLAVTLPQWLQQSIFAPWAYRIFSLILLMIMMAALGLFRHWYRRNITISHRPPALQINIIRLFRTLPQDSQKLFVIYGLSMLASAIPAISLIFFVRDRLDALPFLGLFLLLYLMSGLLAMPIWQHQAQRYGKYHAWLLSMLLAVAGFVGAFFLTTHDIIPYGIICIMSGMALGADLALPPSILGDHIRQNHTENSIATQFSLLALLSKIGLTLASALTFPMLDMIGFIPGAANTAPALLGLSILYALVPCLIKLGTACLIYYCFIQPKGY